MTLVPRTLVQMLAHRRMRKVQREFQAQGDGTAAQTRWFRWLLARLTPTELGRMHGLGAKMTYDHFRAAVPLRTTAGFLSFAERMAAGAHDILWPGPCRSFVYTAGTVDGTPKMLPATDDLLRHFRAALRDVWLLQALRTDRADTFCGLNLHTGASTALTSARGARAGFFDGMVRASLSDWARDELLAPPAAISDLPEGPEKAQRIAEACAMSDVRSMVGSPASLIATLQAARTGRPDGRHPWNNLSCCIHTGAIPGISARALAEAAGPGVVLHEAYGAAQGIFAAQDGEARHGLRLFANAGLFFEFLPVRDATSGDLSRLGDRCVPLARARVDTDYLLVVTTPAGLCRCLVGDTVRFVSLQPPRLLVTGRAEFLLDSFGEKVTERELSDALIEVCATNGWDAVDFHVAPYFTRPQPRLAGCHEWWVELKPGTIRTPTGPILGAELDAELGRRNRLYAAQRSAGALEPPLVRLVMPGVFTQWSVLHPTFGGPGKLARCRNDRVMADQLAGIARFHASTLPPPYPGTRL